MTAKKKAEVSEEVQNDGSRFSKEQIITSARYRNQRDLVDALLEDEKKYTFETVDNLIEKYKKGQVK